MRLRRIVMHAMDARIARRLGQLLECDVTLSENHPADKITLYGFDDVLEETLPVLRAKAPGWYVRLAQCANG